MTSFVRPAAWLRQLFIQSRTEHVNPSRVSDDVSLVQPYDGSGWGIPDPANWAREATSGVGISATTTIYTVPVNRVARILAVGVHWVAGATFNSHLRVQSGTDIIAVSNDVTVPITGENIGYDVRTPVMGPGHVLSARHTGGDASSQAVYSLYYVECPIGTVFYV